MPLQAKADIVFSVHANNPPFVYVEGKELKGFAVDLAKEIGKVLNEKVDFLPTSYQSEAIEAVKDGRADAVLVMGFYEGAGNSLVPTDPYFYPYYVMAVKKGSNLKLDDLKQKSVAVVGGSALESYLISNGFKNVVSLASHEEVLEALESGQVDGAFMVEQSYGYLTEKLEISDTILLPEKVQLAQYAIGVSEKDSI
nr:transporter substrate-binding domain-containing protein [Coprothermobacter proteolyticus]